MHRLEQELSKRGWTQVGAGHWAHEEIEKAEVRFLLEEAVLQELARQQARAEYFRNTARDLRNVLDSKVEAERKGRVGLVDAAGVMQTSPAVIGPKERTVIIKNVDCLKEVANEEPELKGAVINRPFCMSCGLLMTKTSGPLGENPEWLCSKCKLTAPYVEPGTGKNIADHEQAIGHLTCMVRVLVDEYMSRTGLKVEPLHEKFLEDYYEEHWKP